MPPEPEKTEDKPAGDSPDREPPFFHRDTVQA